MVSDLDDARSRLRRLATEWKSIGSPPFKDGTLAVEAAKRLVREQLAPLCAAIVQAAPDGFPDPGNPPPIHGIGLVDFTAEKLTGAPSPVEAGRRLVFWLAATVPTAGLRSHPSDTQAMWRAMKAWFIFFDQQARSVRTWHQPMNWIVQAVDAATGTNGRAAPASGQRGDEPPNGFLGGEPLADALGVHPSRRAAFYKQLERKRPAPGDDTWQEVRNLKPNSPRYLYRADSAAVRMLAAQYAAAKPA